MASHPDKPHGFPSAEGIRLPWEALPRHVREEVEFRLEGPVVGTTTLTGGFSPGFAARVQTADGRRHFVKAVARATNTDSSVLYQREARIAAALPARVPCARFRWLWDGDDWIVLCFDYIEGQNPKLPWQGSELDRVLHAMTELAKALTPSPIDAESVAESRGTTFRRWRLLADDPDQLARIPQRWRTRLDDLIALEDRWPALAAGDTLLHLDIRADNIIIDPDQVRFVDWPWACTGAAWLDLVAFLPSVAMQGGPDPQEIFDAHPLGRDADQEAVNAFLAGLAGMFTVGALRPPPPGLPTVRAFQAAQGVTARKWLANRLGWPDIDG